MTYSIRKESDLSYEETIKKVTDELQKEGFGVLTEIDVKETLKKKLDIDHNRFMILGACNPPLAHRALTAEPEIGVLLPCNVIVYETDEGKTVVSAINAKTMFSVVDREDVLPVAEEVSRRLQNVINNV
jgi:uncharacterized protein (DUF302 family)